MQDISNTAPKGIHKFLEIYPLKRPPVIDIQRHTDPNEKVGIVPLTLWQKTMEFAPSSLTGSPSSFSIHTIIAASKVNYLTCIRKHGTKVDAPEQSYSWL